jgi:hypothetical protein
MNFTRRDRACYFVSSLTSSLNTDIYKRKIDSHSIGHHIAPLKCYLSLFQMGQTKHFLL